jgi:hypothetical protein
VLLGGGDLARMMPGPEHPSVAAFLADRHAYVDFGSLRRATAVAPRLWLDLQFGNHLAIENSLSSNLGVVRYTLRDSATGRALGEVRGRLRQSDLTGGFRFVRAIRPEETALLFTRLGYGWSWYELRDATIAGEPLPSARRRGGYYPSIIVPSRRWWPNTIYGGVGVELFAPKSRWLLRRQGYGFRLEATGRLHRLSGETVPHHRRVTVESGDVAAALLLGW